MIELIEEILRKRENEEFVQKFTITNTLINLKQQTIKKGEKLPVCSGSLSNPRGVLLSQSKILCHSAKVTLPGGFTPELGVGARSPLCLAGRALDFGIVELVGGGMLPVLLP